MVKLKQKDIKQYREQLLKKQHNICPLCKTWINTDQACLDHDHDTGFIRFVLHRNCNGIEGRVVSWANRSKATDKYEFLKNLYDLHRKDYSSNPTHPTYLTPTEVAIKRLKKHQKKLKTQRGKQNIQIKIQELGKLK